MEDTLRVSALKRSWSRRAPKSIEEVSPALGPVQGPRRGENDTDGYQNPRPPHCDRCGAKVDERQLIFCMTLDGAQFLCRTCYARMDERPESSAVPDLPGARTLTCEGNNCGDQCGPGDKRLLTVGSVGKALCIPCVAEKERRPVPAAPMALGKSCATCGSRVVEVQDHVPTVAAGRPGPGLLRCPRCRRELYPSSSPKTSADCPIRVDWIPEAHLSAPGRLGLTFAPGKKDVGRGGRWDRDLGADLALLRAEGVDLIACFLEDAELKLLQVPDYPEEAGAMGFTFLRLPIRDVSTPAFVEPVVVLVDTLLSALNAGRNVLLHCRGGLGRAGMIAACCLVAHAHESAKCKMDPARAVEAVREARPGAVETKAQGRFVALFAQEWRER